MTTDGEVTPSLPNEKGQNCINCKVPFGSDIGNMRANIFPLLVDHRNVCKVDMDIKLFFTMSVIVETCSFHFLYAINHIIIV